ncbi:glycosyltransferase [Halomonas huangheensis]|uniref:Glycosyltransferase subfamily 4-like N-terminal domain-containing protein n=1 Tax=Halomonas huangheensis TaxID=1178482 RepID=W1NCR6_9GAMM|nr:glycosyltransferase [Halomonas huangheensis]ALM52811.1 hypothetical protein AR456_11360 [Halomonas huangheensis]ERL53278.1 hypothetical protein BJB45_18575 [Halomonas huangheensis]
MLSSPSRAAVTSVLFVVDHLDSGGAPIVVRDLIKGMHQQGVAVTLVVLSDRVSHQLPEGVELVTLPLTTKSRAERRQRYALHARMLDDWFSRHGTEFGLVMAHLHHSHQVVSRSRLSDQAWYCLHSDPVTEFLGNKSGLSRWLKRRKVRALYDHRKVVTVSHAALERLCQIIGARPLVARAIPNPVDIEQVIRRSEEAVDDVPPQYLVFVGRMDLRAKRFDRLLDAYQASETVLPLILVGGGDQRAAVDSMIEARGLTTRVKTLGHRDNPYPYMRCASALLLSSDYEGFSLVLVEALACGTPVVSVDCPTGPGEILIDEMRDYLVPVDDIAAFGSAIRRVLEVPPEIPQDICLRFQLDTVVASYLALADLGSQRHASSR